MGGGSASSMSTGANTADSLTLTSAGAITDAINTDITVANNASFSGGFIEHRSERFTVRGLGLATGSGPSGGPAIAASETYTAGGTTLVLSRVK